MSFVVVVAVAAAFLESWESLFRFASSVERIFPSNATEDFFFVQPFFHSPPTKTTIRECNVLTKKTRQQNHLSSLLLRLVFLFHPNPLSLFPLQRRRLRQQQIMMQTHDSG